MASGNLGYELLQKVVSKYNVVAILTDAKSELIVALAREYAIDCFIGNPRKGKASSFIRKHKIEVLVSINYLFLIEKDLINWPKALAFNIHGSLLPKYRGRTPHVWAIINNEKVTGITAHVIDEGCDTGAIIEQVPIPILPSDTGADMLKKYTEQYPVIIDKVLTQISNNRLSLTEQDSERATYFGKRAPDDGQINWDWQRERVINWVRAQAAPYPGAFSWIKAEKVIIDQVLLDDYGFHQETPNGTILTLDPLRVKTPNGVLQITKIRPTLTILQVGTQLQ